jgi:hypothetical protein
VPSLIVRSRRHRLNAGSVARTAAWLYPALLALALPGSLAAQASGRWRLVIAGGAPGAIRAELTLRGTGDRLAGELLVETRDSAPARVTGGREGPAGQIEFTAPLAAPVRFVGQVRGDRVSGTIEGDANGPRTWEGERLAPGAEYYAVLPRFTLRQIVAGRRDSVIRLPGPWVAAALEQPPHFDADYRAAAVRAGVEPLPADELRSGGALRALGLLRRDEMLRAVRGVMQQIRAALPADSDRARFDYLFQPRGRWQVDIHEVALARARLRFPRLDWPAALPALQATGWIAADAEVMPETVPLALYRLLVFAAADSARYAEVRARMTAADAASAGAVGALLDGYASAWRWHAEATAFLLTTRWLPTAGGARAPAELVRGVWPGGTLPDTLLLPPIGARLFGHPQAVPLYGVPQPLFPLLVRPANWSAERWLERHGAARLLAALRQLPPAEAGTTVELAGETLRLSSVREEARIGLNGFLEPADAIGIDPGFVPLLALGTVVHEWQHLLFEHARQDRSPGATADGMVTLVPADPYLAEGFAEWQAERIMAPLAARYPLLGLAEAEKRARLALEQADESHLLGLLLVRAVARALPRESDVVELLLRRSARAQAVAAQPALVRAWARHAGARDRTISAPTRRSVIPETTFTLEDGFPDVVGRRILMR